MCVHIAIEYTRESSHVAPIREETSVSFDFNKNDNIACSRRRDIFRELREIKPKRHATSAIPNKSQSPSYVKSTCTSKMMLIRFIFIQTLGRIIFTTCAKLTNQWKWETGISNNADEGGKARFYVLCSISRRNIIVINYKVLAANKGVKPTENFSFGR